MFCYKPLLPSAEKSLGSGNVQYCVGKHWGELQVQSVFKVTLNTEHSSSPDGEDSTQAAGISAPVGKKEGAHENSKGWGF